MRAVVHVLLALVAGCDGAQGSGSSGSADTSSPSSTTGEASALDAPATGEPTRSTTGATSSGTGEAGSTSTGPASGTTQTSGSSSDVTTATDPTASDEGETDPTGTTGGEGASTGASRDDDDLVFRETFHGWEASAWPAPWQELGGLLDRGVDDQGRGFLRGESYTVARMYLPGYAETDVDMLATVTFVAWDDQGVGLYARHNGGWLANTDPPGQGYVAFLEGGFLEAIGIWREHEGVEEPLAQTVIPSLPNGVPHKLRFQCEQVGAVTHLRARVWPADEAEPLGWDIEHIDDTPALQDVADGFAVDQFNYMAPLEIFFDDIEIRTLP